MASPSDQPDSIAKNRFRLRPLLLLAMMALIIMQIVALMPSSLEQNNAPEPVAPETLIHKADETLAPGIPKDRIPEYSVDQFNYVSTHAGKRQWKMVAEKAFLYNEEKLVHARNVTTYLFNPDGRITVVTSKEAKFYMNKRDMEAFGNVNTQFPDDFATQSEYLRHRPSAGKIEIPVKYRVTGGTTEGPSPLLNDPTLFPPSPRPAGIILTDSKPAPLAPSSLKPTPASAQGSSGNLSAATEGSSGQIQSNAPKDQKIAFVSMGLDFSMTTGLIHLPQAVKFRMFRNGPKTETSQGVPEETLIESDHCLINRNTQVANFTMSASRPLKSRFVRIIQPTLFAHARRAELHYGDYSQPQMLQYMTTYEDVLIKETPPLPMKDGSASESEGKPSGPAQLRYGTAGRADFDTRRDVVVLTGFPQVYQDNDTMTGDIITVHRDTDIVEVEHSNAFNSGEQR